MHASNILAVIRSSEQQVKKDELQHRKNLVKANREIKQMFKEIKKCSTK